MPVIKCDFCGKEMIRCPSHIYINIISAAVNAWRISVAKTEIRITIEILSPMKTSANI